MKPILEIQNVSKKYKIQHEKQAYLNLRENIFSIFKAKHKSEEFYALKDINFNIMPGESIGIIGKNGAGKSTLLKILSKITPPSSGKIISRGRIASLLEVGTGFHPELSGRENIFLNGSILGMKRKEILSKFDEIVTFSGVEKFLDTPLKHYSSGMQLRLAFAVAAFLEPEILVIDEVLAVGDAEFQKRCLQKMDDVSKSGRTILFVSHNMGALKQLCSKSIVLKSGQLIEFNLTNNAINNYLIDIENNPVLKKELSGFINKIELKCNDHISQIMYAGCDFKIEVSFNLPDKINFPVLGIIFRDEYNLPVLAINNKHYIGNLINQDVNSGKILMHIPFLPLFTGQYTIDIHFGNAYKDLEVLSNVTSFNVDKSGIVNALEIPDEKNNRYLIENINWIFTK